MESLAFRPPLFQRLSIRGHGGLHASIGGVNFWLLLFAAQVLCSVAALLREGSGV